MTAAQEWKWWGLFLEDVCVLIPLVWKLPSSWQTPGHLFPDPGNYTTLLPLRSQGSQSERSSFPPPLSLMLRLIPISPSREESHLHCYLVREDIDTFVFCIFAPAPMIPDVLSSLSSAPAPAPCQIDTIYGKMLIGTTRLFVNGAFCINQLTVGRGQQKLQKAMEISSKTSSKGRKSWMWKLMVRPGALWDVLERAREIFVFWFLTMVK